MNRDKVQEGALYCVLAIGGCARCAHIAKPSAAPVSLLSAQFPGLGQNGGYAEYIVVDQSELVLVVCVQHDGPFLVLRDIF